MGEKFVQMNCEFHLYCCVTKLANTLIINLRIFFIIHVIFSQLNRNNKAMLIIQLFFWGRSFVLKVNTQKKIAYLSFILLKNSRKRIAMEHKNEMKKMESILINQKILCIATMQQYYGIHLRIFIFIF